MDSTTGWEGKTLVGGQGRVAGQVALVTGAARGQGRAHALRLAEEGAAVIAVDVGRPVSHLPYDLATQEDLDETARLVRQGGGTIITARTDVRDVEELAQVVNDAVRQLGRLDIVVANAGIGTLPWKTHEMPPEVWRTMIDVNLTGVWSTARAGIPHIIEGGSGGSIIMISSSAGLKGQPNISHYVAAKTGVVGLMRSLASELAEHSIRVNSIHPTQVHTPMIINEQMFRLFSPELDQPTIDDFSKVAQSMNLLPTPWVDARDVSNAVLFLASSDGRYITGTALPVDAGAVLR
ncbi:mycofactocin-coupled SDR family oxidoreductase [Jatrophihabitans sp. DSM 45814]